MVKVGLLGLGTVGTGTVQILLDPDQRHALLRDLEIHRVGVRSLDKPRRVDLPPQCLTTDLQSIVSDPAVDIVVEVLGGLEPARSLILAAISHRKHVVTANKAVIARYGDEIFATANQFGVYVMLEAAVGGGIPVIQPLKQSLCSNRIHTLTGIVNGTTNYILSRMQQEGGDFADILADAQRLGYAEADPTADVDGLDAADKIAILAALAFGGRLKLDQVHCEGIRQVGAVDIAYAEKLGFVIKLLAIARNPLRAKKSAEDNSSAAPSLQLQASEPIEVRVHPTLVPRDHPLASVSGVYNAILVEADPLGQVMFFGPGAGAGPTASAVVSDILSVTALLKMGGTSVPGKLGLHPLLTCSHQHYCPVVSMQELVTRFYARFLTQDQPGVIGKIGTCFGDHKVSLESIVQTGIQANLAEIVVVTHHVRERNFHQALEQIRSLAAIDSVPSLLRVL